VKVLIVEDDLMIADMAEEALAEQGYEVCGIARTVDEGFELGRRHQPDLALVDQRLANNGLGTDLVARLGNFSKIGILYATGNVADVILSAKYGHACLAKPYSPTDLIQSMKFVGDIVAGKHIVAPFPKGFQALEFPPSGEQFPNDLTEGMQLRRLLKQQASLAAFGSFALRETDLTVILQEAAQICADGLNAPLSKICRYRENENDLIIESLWETAPRGGLWLG
jgi:DNA-binding response OmpR family regulator